MENNHPYTTKFCQAYLSADQASPVDITARVTEAELEEEKRLSPGFSDGYIENICLYRSICMQLPKRNRFLLHCSVLAYKKEGYAFLGRSGTGKSTHTKLWLRHLENCKIVNGDKPIIEYRNGEFIAYGTPWMGKEHWGENTSVPLKGLCFLQQEKENSIRKLTVSEFSTRLFTQILLPSEEENAAATLELADKLVTTLPSYLLGCTISEEAVKVCFEGMTGYHYVAKGEHNEN